MSKWEMVKLGEVCFSQTKSKIKAGEGLQFGEYKFFTSSSVQSKFLNTYNYEQQALIFGTGGNANIHHCDTPFATSTDCIVFYKSTDKIDLKYTYLYLLGNIHLLQSGFKGAGLKHISKDYIQNIELPLPPLETQKKIADELDKISSLIEKRKSQIEKLDLLTKAKFVEMFGDPVTNELGWEKGTIRDIVQEVKYGTSKPSVDGGKYPYLRMNNITYGGHLDLTNLKYIDIDDKEYEKCVVRNGDVLFNRTNSKELVGKTCVYNLDTEMIIAGYIIRVRVNEKVIPLYLSAVLNSKYGKETLFDMCKAIVGQANINAQELQDIKILVPPLDLQNKFAEYIEKIEKTRYNMEKGLEQLEVLYKERMQEYFG